MSQRAYPEELTAIEYGPGDIVRKTDITGCISFKSQIWRIGKAFHGEPVALRPTSEDGVFTVRYGAHPIATIDLKQLVSQACGLADNAAHCPQGPQAQHQQRVFE